MSDTEEQPTAVVVTEQPKRALPGTGSKTSVYPGLYRPHVSTIRKHRRLAGII